MYAVLIGDIHGNDTPLYYPDDKDYVIYDTSLNQEVGLCGEFTFKVPVTNPLYSTLEEFKIITITEDNKEIWRGFIKEMDESSGIYAEVYSLEDLAWLQTEYVAPVQQKVDRATKLRSIVSDYNALSGVAGTVKTFEAGYVINGGVGTFEVDYNMSLLEGLRGLAGDDQYVRVRRVYTNGILHRYIDFVTLNSFGKTSTQDIQFGRNLVDFIKELNTSWMLNVIYPYGMEIDGEEVFEGCTRRVPGTPLSDSIGVNKYGRIAKNILFNTSDPATLQTQAAQYLEMNKNPRLTLEFTAVDLAQAGYAVDRLNLGDKVRVVADPLRIDQYVYITELNIDLQKPESNAITLSSVMTSRNSLTEQTNQIAAEVINKIPSRSSILAAAKENAIAMLNGSEGGVVNFIFDNNDRMTEIWITDSIDPSLASKKWVWNGNGLGYMYFEDNQWKLSVAMTMDGSIVANRITTGILGDQAGRNFWNMETGEFSLSAATTVGGSTVDQIATQKANSARQAAENTAAAALSSAVATINSDISDLQDQIDGNVTTWYYTGTPTLNNLPASQWTTTTDKDNHIGDIYYDSTKGYAYRFMLDGSTYKWVKISDSDISAALSEAQDAWDLADGKRRVFISQPVPPYDIGDMWVQGSNGDILRCKTKKTSGQAYASGDWILASKYTDDSALTAWVSGTYATDKTNLQSQIDGKAETWYQSSDPSTGWTPTQKAQHEGDLWYDTDDGTTWYYKNGQWVQQDVPEAVFDKIDGKAQVFTSQPTTPYYVGDLWFNSTTSDIMTCMTARTTGSYNANDWKKRNKYTDDSSLTTFISGAYTTDKTNLQNQIDGKAETWYQANDPSSAWTTVELQAAHVGDLWYKTSDNTTWYWDGANWVQENVPNAVFDKIDGKAQIFTSQPTTPYFVGDLWFNDTSSEIKVCTTARSAGAYVATDWAKRDKYVDSATVSSAIGSYDSALNQAAVFNKLTNNGQTQGIYLSNGKLYINASYIAAGIIADAAGKFSLNMSTGALTMNAGTFKGTVSAGTVSGSTISGGTISGASISGGTITGANIKSSNAYATSVTMNGGEIVCDGYGQDSYIRFGRYGNLETQYQLGFACARSHARGYGGFPYLECDSYKIIEAANNASDIRLKTEIETLTLEEAWIFIDASDSYKFEFKNRPGTKRYGLIAQEFKNGLEKEGIDTEHLRVLNKNDFDEMYCIEYQELVPHLIKVVKALRDEILELKATITNMKGAI